MQDTAFTATSSTGDFNEALGKAISEANDFLNTPLFLWQLEAAYGEYNQEENTSQLTVSIRAWVRREEDKQSA
jgi:hypothetical protein